MSQRRASSWVADDEPHRPVGAADDVAERAAGLPQREVESADSAPRAAVATVERREPRGQLVEAAAEADIERRRGEERRVRLRLVVLSPRPSSPPPRSTITVETRVKPDGTGSSWRSRDVVVDLDGETGDGVVERHVAVS